MKNNSILFSSVDREDYWVSSGLCLKVENIGKKTCEEIYNEVKSKIETKEVINYVIEDNCLDCDLFDNDETYKFKRTYWDYALVYEFENNDGDVVDFRFGQTDTILCVKHLLRH